MENQTYENVVGKKLKRIREAHRMSEQQMADYIGVPKKTYQEYESGARFPENLPPELIKLFFVS